MRGSDGGGHTALRWEFLGRAGLPLKFLPAQSGSVFFPFVDGTKITEKYLKSEFPKTWAYLLKHRGRLEKRKALVRYRKAWWEPMWPREPDSLLRPKLVVPHLVIMPRFALDGRGRYAVSHSPFLIARVPNGKGGPRCLRRER